jgi:hypothetical protein
VTNSHPTDGTERYLSYYRNIQWFIENVLASETTSMNDYVTGRQKLNFHDSYLGRSHLNVEDPLEMGGISYETALYSRVTSEVPCRLLVLIGGLGSGKTTAVRYLMNAIDESRESLSSTFACSCQPCRRKPIYVNCIDIQRDTKPDVIYRKVLQGIRFEIYNAMIDGFLAVNGIARTAIDSADRVTLRRLLITNDLSAWADLEHPGSFPHALRTEDCDIQGTLLSRSIGLAALKELISQYRTPTRLFEAKLVELIRDPDDALHLTSMIIGMYLDSCNPLSPNNLIVVDNIDQVPTEYIERVAAYLGELSDRNGSLRLLVPMRPSSITRSGFVKAPRYLAHYGPNCFEMLSHRINKYVLSKSRQALSQASPTDHTTPFVKQPMTDELDVFISTTYLYSSVLAAGQRQGDKAVRPAQPVFPVGMHDDHRFARAIKLSSGVARHFAETLGAVVGTCARYATEQILRYYEHIYSSPGLLASVASAAYGARTTIRLPYGPTISSLLGRAEGDSGRNGLANLYRATEYTGAGDWPTLAKIRILRYLKANGSSTITDVIAVVGQSGIPAEIAVAALNYLHRKERLLVWFSRNSDLSVADVDLKEEVVISEHGEQYLDHVVGDFEYIWFSAAQIPPLLSGDPPIGFHARLQEYSRLMSRIAATEWKQLSFQRAAANSLWDEGSAGRAGELITLSLLYQSLARAFTSAWLGVFRINRPARGVRVFKDEIEETIASLCDAVVLNQARFRCAFGDAFYLTAEAASISSVRPHLAGVLSTPLLSERCQMAVQALFWSWDENPDVSLRFVSEMSASEPPADLITSISKYLRGVIPGITAIISALDKVEGGKILLWSVLERRRGLAELLERRLPTFTIVKRHLTLLQLDLQVAEEAARAIAATGTESAAWLRNELTWVRNSVAVLDENRFETIPFCKSIEMSDKKRRSNNVLGMFAEVAQRVGVSNVSHLDQTWL